MYKYIILFSSMLLAIIGQILLKKGVVTSSLAPNLGAIIDTFFSPLIIIGLSFYALSAVFWLFVLQQFPLSVAVPTLSLSYIIILFISSYLFGETVTLTNYLGVIIILLGLIILHHQ